MTMSTEEDYRTESYCFFDTSRLFNELASDEPVSGPWYFCEVTSIARWYDSELRSLSALGFKVAKWWLENKKKRSKISYSDAKGRFLVFDNEKLAHQFRQWYDKQKITKYDDTNLWPTRDSFYQELEETGKIHIEQKIDVEVLFEQYEEDILTEEIFDIYCWMEDNLGKIYYWDSDLYFHSEKDAVAFKLKWM